MIRPFRTALLLAALGVLAVAFGVVLGADAAGAGADSTRAARGHSAGRDSVMTSGRDSVTTAGRDSVMMSGRDSAITSSETSGGAISVSGPKLLRDGVPWLPRGVQIVGLVAPDGALWGKYVAAHAHFGASELRTAASEGADLVRIQVSQFGLDPDSSLYSPAYVTEVEDGVDLARRLGLDVDLSLQAEPPAGEPDRCPLPDAGAERAWNTLAPLFAGDPGVMFELYNEPAVSPTPANWELWRSGGLVVGRTETCDAVGMQTLIDDIRTDGADNVIIVPGVDEEGTLAGMPGLQDPADPSRPQLVYGIHYPTLRRKLAAWNTAFGSTSARVPVLVTEWDANSTRTCVPDAPARATLLLDYLATHRIGVVGFAFDLPGTIVANFAGTPTDYRDFACGVAGDGPGRLLLGDDAGEVAAERGTGAATPTPSVLSVADVRQLVTAGDTRRLRALDTPLTFVTGASDATLQSLSVGNAVPTARFSSVAALASALAEDRLRCGTHAVLLALGQTSRTPLGEQLDPAAAYAQAAKLADAHRLLLVAAPELALVRATDPEVSDVAEEETLFVQRRIAAAAAHDADVYAIEAPPNATELPAFIARVSKQAAAAQPGIEVVHVADTPAVPTR